MISLVLALALAAAPQEIPAVCDPAPGVALDWAACAEALPEGSDEQRRARLNQAAQAYLGRDYGEAERLYDATAGNEADYADIVLRTYRAETYRRVGRDKAAAADARAAWLILSGDSAYAEERRRSPTINEDIQRGVLQIALPILKAARDPEFEAAFRVYRGLPVKGADGHASLAVVLDRLGDIEGALAASLTAVKAEPANAGYLNNHCYILVRAGRPAEGLPYCEKAVEGAPQSAPTRHSLAAALAGLGRCDESATALAEARRLDPATLLYQQALPCTAR